ncbi:MAG: hypothetical protein P4L74_02460 [Candidatus Doudnabacteria bacterium]|nr:hypothetical protein [Candidatus Doudnabacteria bacterium]
MNRRQVKFNIVLATLGGTAVQVLYGSKLIFSTFGFMGDFGVKYGYA